MNTIERKLLAVTYPNIDVTLLEEIINATPNATLACEIMCGLYENPVIVPMIWKDDKLCTLESYDKWTDRVHYTFEQPKRVNEYYPSEVDKTTITADNYLKLRCSYREDHTYSHTITLDVMEIRKDYMGLDQWMKYHSKKPYISEGKQREIDAANMYMDAEDVVATIVDKM